MSPRLKNRLHIAIAEVLETRRLLASAVVNNNFVLVVQGDDVSETITVEPSASGATVKINAATFAISEPFSSIHIDARAGNDKVTVSGGVTEHATIRGGPGNDSLVGGDEADTLDGGAGGDTMRGGAGLDTVDYSSRTANVTIGPGTLSDDGEAGEGDNVATDIETILGGGGNDHIKGTSAANLLWGNFGNDTLLGFGGNDTLEGSVGLDRLDGGSGTDTAINEGGDTLISIEDAGGAFIQNRVLFVKGTASNDSFGVHAEEQGVTAFDMNFDAADFDSVVVQALGGNDFIGVTGQQFLGKPISVNLGAGNDVLDALVTDASVIGGDGDDHITLRESSKLLGFDAGAGVDSISLRDDAAPVDTLELGPTVENATSQFRRDVKIIGNSLNNSLIAFGGTLQGGGGNDFLRIADETEDPTLIEGGEGNDTIWGEGFGDDTLDGGAGNDEILSTGPSPSNDLLLGGPGNDTLNGGHGNDTLDGGTGADIIRGSDGNDTVDYSSRTGNLTIGIGTLADDGEAGEGDNVDLTIETVLGGSGNDNIRGGAANNLLVGNGGNDTLFGNYGNDTLQGGLGNDDLNGGPDGDTLDGGDGSDRGKQSAADLLISIEQPY